MRNELLTLKKRATNNAIANELQSIIFNVDLGQYDLALARFSDLRDEEVFPSNISNVVNKVYSALKKNSRKENREFVTY